MQRNHNFFLDITRIDETERMVWGYGTRGDLKDSYGTIIDLDSVRNCLPDYLQYRNVREMHQPSAVGTADEVTIDDNGVMLGVHVVDDSAWNKVVNRVYKGFSIGGKKDYQDGDRVYLREITEFSLVDRPANAGCTIDAFRLYGEQETDMDTVKRLEALSDVKRFAGEEISDVRTALGALDSIMFLLPYEENETHPEAAEQVAALKAAIEALKKFIASEIKEITTGGTVGTVPEIPLMQLSEGNGDVERSGSRHSSEDMTRLNTIRDALGSLGVTLCERCARVEDSAGGDDDVQRSEADADTITRLQGEADTLRAEIDTLRAENATLKAEPEPPKGITRVVEKSEDTGGVAVTRTEEPTSDPTEAIKRIHAAGGTTIHRM